MSFGFDFHSPFGLLLAITCAFFSLFIQLTLLTRLYRDRKLLLSISSSERLSSLLLHVSPLKRRTRLAFLFFSCWLLTLALFRPKFEVGEETIPSTSLDVILVMDYSKSMYARDVVPNRITRAKIEVQHLVEELKGARFGAVAFAGESIAYPLSDGPSIASALRDITPNDMPVGGTATAKALVRARELITRDPKSKEHAKVIVLITDGEDLEGDPVSAAKGLASQGVRVDVVQIGNTRSEVLPEVDDKENVVGVRKTPDGKVMTTELTPAGEAQLEEIAKVTGGEVYRSIRGETGIAKATESIRRLMREELSEKKRRSYDEVFAYPLYGALFFLMVEPWIFDRRRSSTFTKKGLPLFSTMILSCAKIGLYAAFYAFFVLAASACSKGGWSIDRPFEHESSEVNRAIELYKKKRPTLSRDELLSYLQTKCVDESFAPSQTQKRFSNATFDLSLAFFEVVNQFEKDMADRHLFGLFAPHDPARDPAPPPPLSPLSETEKALKEQQRKCALVLSKTLADDLSQAFTLRAKARFVEGNLYFLNAEYKDAVLAYDKALQLEPALAPHAEEFAKDVAYNRALALRLDEEKDQRDAGSPPQNDGGGDAQPDSGDADDGGGDAQPDSGDAGDGGGDAQPDSGDAGDGGGDAGDANSPDGKTPSDASKGGDGGDGGQDSSGGNGEDAKADSNGDSGADSEASETDEESRLAPQASEEESVLEQFERTPSIQVELAKKKRNRKPQNMEDK